MRKIYVKQALQNTSRAVCFLWTSTFIASSLSEGASGEARGGRGGGGGEEGGAGVDREQEEVGFSHRDLASLQTSEAHGFPIDGLGFPSFCLFKSFSLKSSDFRALHLLFNFLFCHFLTGSNQ